jgi:uncharacterized membrane protein YjjP (DUF1212 family)
MSPQIVCDEPPSMSSVMIDDSIVFADSSTSPPNYDRHHRHHHPRRMIDDELEKSQRQWDNGQYYNWRTHFPSDHKVTSILQWIRSGFGQNQNETDEHLHKNLFKLASLLRLLREYYSIYGLPEHDRGGFNEQMFVLREILKDLYAGGGPVWTLEKAIERGAEGLMGTKNVDVGILPRKGFICVTPLSSLDRSGNTTYTGNSTPSHISMFRIQNGFDIQRLTMAEKFLVRIASYASNTYGFSNIPSRYPSSTELHRAANAAIAATTATTTNMTNEILTVLSEKDDNNHKAMLTKRILNLASCAEGLFFFMNSSDRPDTTSSHHRTHHNVYHYDGSETTADSSNKYNNNTFNNNNNNDNNHNNNSNDNNYSPNEKFWNIEDHILELFSRLATIEAIQMLQDGHRNKKVLYSKPIQLLFSFLASAGVCAFWFHGNWIDVLVAGICGLLVRFISGWSFLSKEDRIVFEAIASVLVGLIAGLLSCFYPTDICFTAIGLSGVLDILQGFRVVYSIIEVMAKHSVAGSADFLQGLLYTTLISFFLRVGQLCAEIITGRESPSKACEGTINEAWYVILVPLAAMSWSGLFNPEYYDLPWMTFHGILAYVITWACNKGDINPQVALFLAAFGVTFSSGLVSRFTGRQAMGNTIAGLYVLVPGAYLVNALFSRISFDFVGPVIVNAAIIGTGAWAGTIFCSPTIVGTTAARLRKGVVVSRVLSRNDLSGEHHNHGPMLFF